MAFPRCQVKVVALEARRADRLCALAQGTHPPGCSQRTVVLGAAQRQVADEILDGDAVFMVAIHRQPAEMVNEVVGVRPLRSLAESRQEFVRTPVDRTVGYLENKVRALPVSMVDELHA